MGYIQKDALRTVIISYLGLIIGYVNKGLLFIWFLTAEEIGLVNLLVGVSLLFGNLSGLGSSYAVWKFFPFLRNRDKKNHGFMMLILIVTCIGIAFFSLLTLFFSEEISRYYSEKSPEFVHYYLWIIPLGIANVLFVVLDTFLRSMYKNIVSVFVYELLLRLLITLLLVVYGLDLVSFNSFLVLHCAVYFIPVIYLGIYMHKQGEFHLSLSSVSIPKRFRKIILYFSLFSYVNTISAIIVTTIDAMMIAGMLGLGETGVYTTVIYLTSALQIPYKSLIRVSSPVVADYWKEKNMAGMGQLYKKFSSVNLVIATTLFLSVWICRTEIFHLLPKAFEEGIYVFLFLMIGRLTDMYLGLNGTIFVTSKKYRYDIIFTVSLIAIVSLLNLYMIPAYGITGAAIATCIAYLVYNLGRLLFVYFAYKLHPFERSQLYVLLLFAGTLAFFELVPIVFDIELIAVPVKWLLLGVLFLAPIYFFKMESEIVRYIDNGILFVKKKLGRS